MCSRFLHNILAYRSGVFCQGIDRHHLETLSRFRGKQTSLIRNQSQGWCFLSCPFLNPMLTSEQVTQVDPLHSKSTWCHRPRLATLPLNQRVEEQSSHTWREGGVFLSCAGKTSRDSTSFSVPCYPLSEDVNLGLDYYSKLLMARPTSPTSPLNILPE